MQMLRHVGIVVKSMPDTLQFYRQFGFDPLDTNTECGEFIDTILSLHGVKVVTVKLHNKGTVIELLCPLSHGSFIVNRHIFDYGISHIALTVSEIDPVHNPQTSPDGKVKVAFISDPDGNMVELVEEL